MLGAVADMLRSMRSDDILKRIRAVFPEDPVPTNFFASGVDQISGDIPLELVRRIKGRRWSDIVLGDWNNIAHVTSFSQMLTPSAFRYYVPSLLMVAIENPLRIDLGIEAVLPPNQKLEPRGAWWKDFYSGFSNDQRDVVRAFLTWAISNAGQGGQEQVQAQHGLMSIWR